MKRTVIIAALLLTSISLFAQSGRSFYQKYSDEPGVTAVYISPAMFRMIGSIPDISTGDGEVNLAPIISSLNGMYILSSENPSLSDKIYKDVSKALNTGNYELLMEAKEEGEKVQIFTAGDAATVTSFIMVANEGAELTFIWIDGKMERNQLENLLSDKIVIDN
ncbi:MAG: DUF4252 domain-containing protein [Bacteroidales bacterium]|nr:DUF4252 domain-containing protein [Bacteroidales bacterium]